MIKINDTILLDNCHTAIVLHPNVDELLRQWVTNTNWIFIHDVNVNEVFFVKEENIYRNLKVKYNRNCHTEGFYGQFKGFKEIKIDSISDVVYEGKISDLRWYLVIFDSDKEKNVAMIDLFPNLHLYEQKKDLFAFPVDRTLLGKAIYQIE